jgi:hypothetical protein
MYAPIYRWRSAVLGRFRDASLTLPARPVKCGERGEETAGNEYFRPPKGVHCAKAATRACRVESVIVDNGELEWLPFVEEGVSGP